MVGRDPVLSPVHQADHQIRTDRRKRHVRLDAPEIEHVAREHPSRPCFDYRCIGGLVVAIAAVLAYTVVRPDASIFVELVAVDGVECGLPEATLPLYGPRRTPTAHLELLKDVLMRLLRGPDTRLVPSPTGHRARIAAERTPRVPGAERVVFDVRHRREGASGARVRRGRGDRHRGHDWRRWGWRRRGRVLHATLNEAFEEDLWGDHVVPTSGRETPEL